MNSASGSNVSGIIKCRKCGSEETWTDPENGDLVCGQCYRVLHYEKENNPETLEKMFEIETIEIENNSEGVSFGNKGKRERMWFSE